MAATDQLADQISNQIADQVADQLADQLADGLSSLNVDPQIEFTLCDTEASFLSAVSFLRSSSSLVFDCEGLDLGVDGGSLSLIAILSRNQIFIIDVLSLTCSLDPLLSVLASPDILKIVFDGRMDFCALYHSYKRGFNVQLPNVIDLQLADIKSRFLRQETQEQHSKRLRRCFSYKQVFDPRNADRNNSIHVLQGLVDHDLWLSRPLSPEYLQYAAHDVEIIDALYSHFLQAGYIDSDLPSQSQRYVSIWSDHPPKPDDIYRSHPLLPLDILTSTNPLTSHTVLCVGCARHLTLSSFPKKEQNTHMHKRTQRHCWVCMAVPHWLNMLQIRKEQRELQKEIKKNEQMKQGVATFALFGHLPAVRGTSSQTQSLAATQRQSQLEPVSSTPSTRGRDFVPRGRGGAVTSSLPPSPGTGGQGRAPLRGGYFVRRGTTAPTPSSPAAPPPDRRGRQAVPLRGRGYFSRGGATISTPTPQPPVRGSEWNPPTRGRGYATRGRAIASTSSPPSSPLPPSSSRGSGRVSRGRGSFNNPETTAQNRGARARGGGRARGRGGGEASIST
ncbi:hypothetical protein D9757_007596 [Collybiopsis confluens]|uniref:3'-5' exonuclease domain-containing protein n=1 Tax=Collybiopsis confluens TaxID=2823264 RepID=A0A8H5HER7_9AGAR|nr:hypothetical protein D9757_007596 [Collybiopsis confluens]